MSFIQIIIFVACVVSLPIFSTDIYVSSLPMIANFLNAHQYDVTLSLNSYMFGFALITLVSGIASEYFSKYKILISGLIVFAVASLFIAVIPSINILIYGRLFQGFGAGVGTVIGRLILQERLAYEKYSQVAALSIISSAMTASPIVAPTLGAGLTKWFGFNSLFYFLFLVALCLILITIKLYRTAHPVTTNKDNEENSNHYPFSFKRLWHNYKTLLKLNQFIIPTVGISLTCSAEFIFISNSAFFYQDQLHLSLFNYSFLLSLTLAGFLIGSYVNNKLLRNYPYRLLLNKVSLLCSITSLLPIITYFMSYKLCGITLFISMIINMAGLGIVLPLTQSIALNIAKERGNSSVGLFFFIEFMTITISGFLVSLSNYHTLAMLTGIAACWILFLLANLFPSSESKGKSAECDY